MRAQTTTTTTGFRFIDTYNHIREDLQAGGDYDEEELEILEHQQGVPQFSSSSPPFPPPTTTPHTATLIPHTSSVVQRLTPTPSPSPAPTPSPVSPPPSARSYTPPPTPLTSLANPPPSSLPLSSSTAVEGGEDFSFMDLDMSASFLEELIGQPTPTTLTPTTLTPNTNCNPNPNPNPTTITSITSTPPTDLVTLTPVQPPPPFSTSTLAFNSTTTTTTTSYVAEAATSGCTVVQTLASPPTPTDQQLLTDMDVVDLYDLDRQGRSFYDDLPADFKIKDTPLQSNGCTTTTTTTTTNTNNIINANNTLMLGTGSGDASWIEDLSLELLGGVHTGSGSGSGSGSCLREVGVMGQEDLISALDSWRADVMYTCTQLNISPDPKAWSEQDTQAWVSYVLDRDQRCDDSSARLAITGAALCQKSEDQLQWVSRDNGPYLRQQLDLWIAVADMSPALPPTPLSHQQLSPSQLTSPQSGATLSHLPPSVSPAPSTDSGCGSDDWCQDNSESEDVFLDSTSNLSPPTQQQRQRSTTTSRTHKPVTTASGRQPGSRSSGGGKQIRLWEFLRELLELADPAIKWLDRARGIFKIEDSNRVAKLWGERKNHPAMNYDKLSRSVRQYYKKGIIKKTAQSRRLVYQFCERFL